MACPACGAAFDGAAALTHCPSCGLIVPPHPHATPFARLGLSSPRFDVDDKALEGAWLQLSRKLHPDRYAQKSDAERRFSVEQTAALNDAYKLWRDPFSRAAWHFARADIREPKAPQALLLELMDARETAEEGPTQKAAVVASSTHRFELERERLLRNLSALGNDISSSSPGVRAVLEREAERLATLRMLARLVDDLGGARLMPSLSHR
jgi:molecular chaperone HscB